LRLGDIFEPQAGGFAALDQGFQFKLPPEVRATDPTIRRSGRRDGHGVPCPYGTTSIQVLPQGEIHANADTSTDAPPLIFSFFEPGPIEWIG
jgi:hypothetical protein